MCSRPSPKSNCKKVKRNKNPNECVSRGRSEYSTEKSSCGSKVATLTDLLSWPFRISSEVSVATVWLAADLSYPCPPSYWGLHSSTIFR
jgi:hypothetical protein